MNGYKLKASRDITKQDMIVLCNALNMFYQDATIEPEPISDGGLVFKYNDNAKRYKTMRLRIKHYPWVDKNVISEWKDSMDVLIPKNYICDTFLKAFHETPKWTFEELQFWDMCFMEIGLERKGRIPARNTFK